MGGGKDKHHVEFTDKCLQGGYGYGCPPPGYAYPPQSYPPHCPQSGYPPPGYPPANMGGYPPSGYPNPWTPYPGHGHGGALGTILGAGAAAYGTHRMGYGGGYYGGGGYGHGKFKHGKFGKHHGGKFKRFK